MPAVVALGRRWHTATDDLPLPSALGLAFCAGWTGLLGGALGRIEAGAYCASPAFRAYVASLMCVCAANAVLHAALMHQSAQGSLLDEAARRWVPWLLHAVAAAYSAMLGLNIWGTVLVARAAWRGVCAGGGGSNEEWTAVARAVVFGSWAALGLAILVVALVFNLFPAQASPRAWVARCTCLLCVTCSLSKGSAAALAAHAPHDANGAHGAHGEHSSADGAHGGAQGKQAGDAGGGGAASGGARRRGRRRHGGGGLSAQQQLGVTCHALFGHEQLTLSDYTVGLVLLGTRQRLQREECAGQQGPAAAAPQASPQAQWAGAGALQQGGAEAQQGGAAGDCVLNNGRGACGPGGLPQAPHVAIRINRDTECAWGGSGGGGGGACASGTGVGGGSGAGGGGAWGAAPPRAPPLIKYESIRRAREPQGSRLALPLQQGHSAGAPLAPAAGCGAGSGGSRGGGEGGERGGGGGNGGGDWDGAGGSGRGGGGGASTIVSGGTELDPDAIDEVLQAVERYKMYALGVFGWPMYAWVHRRKACDGVCSLACGRGCHAWAAHRPRAFRPVPPCGGWWGWPWLGRRLSQEALTRFAGLRAEDLVMFCDESEVAGTLPHYVALDHAAREVVVAVRGTMSMADTITDCLWQPAEITEVIEAGGAGAAGAPGEPKAAGAVVAAVAVGAVGAGGAATATGAAGVGGGGGPGQPPGQPCMHRGSGLAGPQDVIACHEGMYKCARAIKRSLEAHRALQEALEMGRQRDKERHARDGTPLPAEDYRVVVTGHSLGAGVAAVLGLLLRPGYPSLRVWAHAPPGGTLSPKAAQLTTSFCTSIVHAKDMVPRLTISNLQHLVSDMMTVAALCKVSKWRVLLGSLAGKRWQQDELFHRSWDEVPASVMATLHAFRLAAESTQARQLPEWAVAGGFVPPGRLLYLEDVKVHKSALARGAGGGAGGALGPVGARAASLQHTNSLYAHQPEQHARSEAASPAGGAAEPHARSEAAGPAGGAAAGGIAAAGGAAASGTTAANSAAAGGITAAGGAAAGTTAAGGAAAGSAAAGGAAAGLPATARLTRQQHARAFKRRYTARWVPAEAILEGGLLVSRSMFDDHMPDKQLRSVRSARPPP